jgi:RNA recognition motif-containing protein
MALFVGSISNACTAAELERLFGEIGPLARCDIKVRCCARMRRMPRPSRRARALCPAKTHGLRALLCARPQKPHGGRPCAFVTYRDEKHAADAVKRFNGFEFQGERLLVEYTRPKRWKPRSRSRSRSRG